MNTVPFNEEEIRSKIIVPLLTAAGFAYQDLSFETSFTIQLGRGVYNVKNKARTFAGGRLDILCKADNKNLFVIELKAEDVEIDKDQDSRQGLTYARLLHTMPPFVIVTNGRNTFVYDVITGKEIDSKTISANQFYADLREDINVRLAALKNFVGYSYENLAVFCDSFNAEQLNLFSADSYVSDPNLLKKYIPELYIDRTIVGNTFKEFLTQEDKTVYAIIGESGVGKTNLLIRLLKNHKEHAHLFYSGTTLQSSFFRAFEFDFNLNFSAQESELNILRKVSTILSLHGRTLLLYIDAVDEWVAPNKTEQLTLLLRACKQNGVKVCLSCKDLLWDELLVQSGLPTTLSNEIFKTIKLENFNEVEFQLALAKYGELLSVEKDDKKLYDRDIYNPFNLRIAFEVSQQCRLPLTTVLDSAVTYESFINGKLNKYNGRKVLFRFLTRIASLLLDEDRIQVTEESIRESLSLGITDELPPELFLSNFLYRYGSDTNAIQVGFYFSKIRDYLISNVVLKLSLLSATELKNVLQQHAKKYVGENAINFFLKNSDSSKRSFLIGIIAEFDRENATDVLLKLGSQQNATFFQFTGDENNILVDHILFSCSNRTEDGVLGSQIVTMLQRMAVTNPDPNALVSILDTLNKHRDKKFDISPEICRLLKNIGSSASIRNCIIERLLNPNYDNRIRRFLAEIAANFPIDDRNLLFRSLLEEESNHYEVFYFAKYWFRDLETIDLRDELIHKFDSGGERLKDITVRTLWYSTLPSTGYLLFERYRNRTYSPYIMNWLCRAICALNHRAAIPLLIESLERDPTSELAEHILIGLGDMQAKEAIPAISELIRKGKKADIWWLSTCFIDIADDTDYETLAAMLHDRNVVGKRYAILMILARSGKSCYWQLVLDGVQDTRLEFSNRLKLLHEFSSELLTKRRVKGVTVLVSERPSIPDDIFPFDALYDIVSYADEISAQALSVLINFETNPAKLFHVVIKSLPQLTVPFNTGAFYLVRGGVLPQIRRDLNDWLSEQMNDAAKKTLLFMQNCLCLAGILGDITLLEKIILNRSSLMKTVGDESLIKRVEHTIRTSPEPIRYDFRWFL